jgi:hypothetical protein
MPPPINAIFFRAMSGAPVDALCEAVSHCKKRRFCKPVE